MKKALSYTITGLLVVFSLFSASCLIQIFVTPQNNHGVARIYGHSFLYVATDSMIGERDDSLPVGTGIIVRQVEAKDLHVGDIVSFFDATISAVNTHRLDKEPEIKNGHYRLHTMGDNASSQHYSYAGETFSDRELIGLVVGHNDALGSFLSFVSPTASGAKEARGDGMSLAWLFPLLGFLPVIGLLVFWIVKCWKKEKKKVGPEIVDGEVIEALPTEGIAETSSPLEEERFRIELDKALLLERYPRSGLVHVSCPNGDKEDLLMDLRDCFNPLLLGQHDDGFYLYVSPILVTAEIEAKAKAILKKHPNCSIGVAFYPDVSKEELLLSALTAAGTESFGVAVDEPIPTAPLTIENGLKEAIRFGFGQATLYLLLPTKDGYFPYAEASLDGYYERTNVTKVSSIDAFLDVAKEGETALVFDAKEMPLSQGKSLSFYAKRFDGGAILFLRHGALSLPPEHLNRLLYLGDFLANRGEFLKQEQDKLNMEKRLEFLLSSENRHAYEIDIKTHRLTYVSKALCKLMPNISVGSLCHKALYGTLSPCPRCPLSKREGIKKPLPCLNSQTLHFLCISRDQGRALIQIEKAKGKGETPLSFIEEFEAMLRAGKHGLLFYMEPEGSEEENRCFLVRGKQALISHGFGANLYDYQNGLVYLLPNLGLFDAMSMVKSVQNALSETANPPLSYYRFSFPDDVTCRLELEATLRSRRKETTKRGKNEFVE